MLNEKQGARLSISGWLHGPVNVKQTIIQEPLPVMKPPTNYDPNDVIFSLSIVILEDFAASFF